MADEEALDRRGGDAERIREVFEGAPVRLAGLEGPDHRYVAANAAYREFFGRPDLLGLSAREVFPELEGQQIFEMMDRVYASGERQTAREWRLQFARRPEATPLDHYIDFVIAPRRNNQDATIGLYVYFTDVTERVAERRAAQAETVEAERYEAARHVVAELQEALLPTQLPVLPGARVAARYLVAAHDQAAGGDWFDAVPLPGGMLAVVVGDIVGHG